MVLSLREQDRLFNLISVNGRRKKWHRQTYTIVWKMQKRNKRLIEWERELIGVLKIMR